MSNINGSNPVRVTLLSFFKTLLLSNSISTNQSVFERNVRAAAAEVEAIASEYFDAHATRSDVIYARFVTILNYISVSQLCKLCEGFRAINPRDAYHDLNAAHVQSGAGIRALHTGCEQGVIPVAISYRHAPHEIINERISILHATVDTSTAERFTKLGCRAHDSSEASMMNTVVVWIDRAVKGLSIDGEWYVRGLLPYALVPILVAHRGQEDFARPWIWLEWRLSIRSFSTKGLIAMLDFRDPLLIAVQALFEPSHMLEQYEYKDEMEEVILDMFAFGLLVMGSSSSREGPRIDAVIDWSDYKIGLTIALACSTTSVESNSDVRYGLWKLDDRDPYGCGLFREGLELILSSAGVELGGSEGFAAYALVDGSTVATKRDGDKLIALTRLPTRAGLILDAKKAEKTLRDHFQKEVRSLQLRYDLCDLVDGKMFNTIDELSVLAACHVELLQASEQRVHARDDAYAVISTSLARKAGLIDEQGELRIRFDKRKAVMNAKRRERYSFRLWVKRVRGRRRGNRNDGSGRNDDSTAEEVVDLKNGEDVRMWLDYNCGTLRWVTPLDDDSGVVFRRMRFRRDSHRASVALRGAPRYVPRKAMLLLAGCDQRCGSTHEADGDDKSVCCGQEAWVLRDVIR